MRYPVMNLIRMGGLLEDYQKENDALKEKLNKLNKDASDKWNRDHPTPPYSGPLFPSTPPFSPEPTAAPLGPVKDFGPGPGAITATGPRPTAPPRAPVPTPGRPVTVPIVVPPAPPPPSEGLPPFAPRPGVVTGIPTHEPPISPPWLPPGLPPPETPPPYAAVPSVDPWHPPKPPTPPPVESAMCPPGQFWDGRMCRGSIGPMPGGVPGGGTQGAATGIQMPGGGGFSNYAGAAFMGAVRLVAAPSPFGAPRFTKPIRIVGAGS